MRQSQRSTIKLDATDNNRGPRKDRRQKGKSHLSVMALEWPLRSYGIGMVLFCRFCRSPRGGGATKSHFTTTEQGREGCLLACYSRSTVLAQGNPSFWEAIVCKVFCHSASNVENDDCICCITIIMIIDLHLTPGPFSHTL